MCDSQGFRFYTGCSYSSAKTSKFNQRFKEDRNFSQENYISEFLVTETFEVDY